MGLPLPRLFAELHGASLEIASEKGHGTTVALRLGAARVVAPPAATAKTEGKSMAAPARG